VLLHAFGKNLRWGRQVRIVVLRRLQGAPLGAPARHRPAVATYPFGGAGLAKMATMLLMAINPSGSAEGILVSSLAAYEVHQTYINPEAGDGKVLLFSMVVNEILGGSRDLLSVLPHAIGPNRARVCHFMIVVFGGSGGLLSCSHTPPA